MAKTKRVTSTKTLALKEIQLAFEFDEQVVEGPGGAVPVGVADLLPEEAEAELLSRAQEDLAYLEFLIRTWQIPEVQA